MNSIMLRSVPAQWKVERLGQLFMERREKVSDEDFPALSVTKNGVVPQMEHVAKTNDGENRKLVRAGDFVINSRSDRRGSSGLSELDGSVSLISIVLEPRHGYPRFLHHLLKSYAFQEEFYRYGHGIVADLWTTRFTDMKGIQVGLPDHPTQKAIADFLDRETARIDQLIEKKLHLADLLEERQSSLITRSVTRGLILDRPHVPIENLWFSSLPAGWMIRRIADISTSLQTGPFGSQLHSHEYVEGGIPVINPSHMQRGMIQADPKVSVDEKVWDRLARHALSPGDIIFARRGELGRCALVSDTESGWLCGTGSLRMRPKTGIASSEYLIWVLSTSGVREWLTLESVGSTMDNLNMTILGRLPLPVPPIDEQIQIDDFLTAKRKRTDALVAKQRSSIDRLREFRSTLITAAVTGQIDVATWGRRATTDRRLEAIEEALGADTDREREEAAV